MSKSGSFSQPPWLLEDEIPQECKNLLSTLPKEKGWCEPHLYQYQGFWRPAWLFSNALACQKHYQAQNTDILLVTAPKSGTTWLKSLAFTILNRKLYPPTHNHHPLLTKNPHELVPFLELNIDFENNKPPPMPNNNVDRRLYSTHFSYVSLPNSAKSSACKLIYICRDPKDAFISLWHFSNKRRTPEMGTISLEEAFELFCRGVSLGGPFWDHVVGYWQESLKAPDKILFLKYEEMIEQPNIHIKRIADFMGCPFSAEELEASSGNIVDEIAHLCSFNNLTSLEVNKNGISSAGGLRFDIFFRRGITQDWKNYLTPDMVDRIDRLTAEKFQGSELKL
ncbi:hypothetical protein ACH5RR_035987 [Cinchona calisaya]|uniref:Sulfotransferase n=1 Tax=Cinchona calisaya TaxID=153742 RepID=A0ABD2Y236_9GENT